MELVLTIRTVKVGSGTLAACTVGGVTVRSARGQDDRHAVQSLLERLSDPHNDDAVIGLELELAGTTVAELGPGA